MVRIETTSSYSAPATPATFDDGWSNSDPDTSGSGSGSDSDSVTDGEGNPTEIVPEGT